MKVPGGMTEDSECPTLKGGTESLAEDSLCSDFLLLSKLGTSCIGRELPQKVRGEDKSCRGVSSPTGVTLADWCCRKGGTCKSGESSAKISSSDDSIRESGKSSELSSNSM